MKPRGCVAPKLHHTELTSMPLVVAVFVCQSERSFAAAAVAHDLHSGVVDAVHPSFDNAGASPQLYPLLSAQPNPHHARQMRVLNSRLQQHHSPAQQSALVESYPSAAAADASADAYSASSVTHISAGQPLSPATAEALFGMGGSAASSRQPRPRPQTAGRHPYNHPQSAFTQDQDHGVAATPQRAHALPLLQLPEEEAGSVRVVPPPPADGTWSVPWPPSAAPSPLVIDESGDGDSQRPRDALAFRVDWERELRLVTDPRADLDRSTAAGESEEDAVEQPAAPVPLFIVQRRERERQKQLQALQAPHPTDAGAAASPGVAASTAGAPTISAAAAPSQLTPRPPRTPIPPHNLFKEDAGASSSQPASARRAAATAGRPSRPVRPLSATAPLAADREPPPRPSLASGKRAPRYTSRAFYGSPPVRAPPARSSSSATTHEYDQEQSYFIAIPPERPWTAEGRAVAASQPPYFNPRTRKQQRHAPILR